MDQRTTRWVCLISAACIGAFAISNLLLSGSASAGKSSTTQKEDANRSTDRLVWSDDAGWNVHYSSDLSEPACFAVSSFEHATDPEVKTFWSFKFTADARWYVLIQTANAPSLVGKQVLLSVDGRLIHSTVAEKGEHPGVVLLGRLPRPGAAALASGQNLRLHTRSGLPSGTGNDFPLEGANAAFNATVQCVAALTEVLDCRKSQHARERSPNTKQCRIGKDLLKPS